MSNNEDLKPIEHTIHATTSKIGDFASSLNAREINLSKKQRKLEKIKKLEIERSNNIENYMKQLSDRSHSFKSESVVFLKEYSDREKNISQEIQKFSKKIDNRINRLKNFQTEKMENEKELNHLHKLIFDAEEEIQILEGKDLDAERVLYELTTKPFTEKDINHELRQARKSEKTAVDAILHLNYRLIHDLRQQISEEKQKKTFLREEYFKLMKENPIIQIDKSKLLQIESNVKALKRREKRIDKEITEITDKKPALKSRISEMKLKLKKIEIEKEKFENKKMNFHVDYHPEYYSSLTDQINKVKLKSYVLNRKLKKSKKKLTELNTIINHLHRKNRQLTEIEIDMEHDSLEIHAKINESHQIELEWQRRDQDDKYTEQKLIHELTELQKLIAAGTGEFDSLIQHQNEFEETLKEKNKEIKELKKLNYSSNSFINDEISSRLKSSINKLKNLKQKIKEDSLKLLANVRNLSENNNFTKKELNVLQAKLHQENFYLHKLEVEKAKFHLEEPPRTSEAIIDLKNRLNKTRLNIQCARSRIDDKRDILSRIAKVNNLSGANALFVIEDGERVIDRSQKRKDICNESSERVERAKNVLNSFCEFYQVIRNEQRTWENEKSPNFQLQKWIDIMHDICRKFRCFGI
ncbi:hypothetical protein TRFO_27759 [Tritrichomonas foetus]|uniref:Uncharacterized protein n=1 Tax=Tritrichomonas foetus TaxID=1144522 RepID=A0A1J4JZT3_9EUKA|nr:hypothetical protein TRFO_27759 [Tritrichomonas foetus]|eukprot:OHT04679.1 hypothetical protein TRFO_27759 [Tritrichomonas foetus]